MERKLLASNEIQTALAGLEGWRAEDNQLKKHFSFADFAEALSFVNRVAEIAETADHHPDITFGWGYADLATTTHDRGGITDVDLALAAKINAIP